RGRWLCALDRLRKRGQSADGPLGETHQRVCGSRRTRCRARENRAPASNRKHNAGAGWWRAGLASGSVGYEGSAAAPAVGIATRQRSWLGYARVGIHHGRLAALRNLVWIGASAENIQFELAGNTER